MNRFLILLSAAACLWSAAGAAPITITMEPQQITRERVVPIGDINLASAAGQRVLATRIKVATHYVCDFWSESAVRASPDYQACVARATEGARGQIGATAATAVRVSAI